MKTYVLALLALSWTISLAPVQAQSDAEALKWNEPVEPFRIAGNLYYVGAKEVAAYLVATPEGHVLLDGGLPETAARIEAGVERLGFHLKDVKILLKSHAHFDHAGGLAALKAKSGARLLASAGDAPVLAAGGKGDFLFGDTFTFPPVAVDRQVRDRETVTLGGTTLTAHLTPGHTKGCTSWEIAVRDGAETRHAVVLCSLSILPQARLTGKPSYTGIAGDFLRSYALLKALPCDIFLAAHGSFFDLLGKREIQKKADEKEGRQSNPFVDRDALRRYVESKEKGYRERLEAEKGS
jgi:metallo-beta-lactamase class B